MFKNILTACHQDPRPRLWATASVLSLSARFLSFPQSGPVVLAPCFLSLESRNNVVETLLRCFEMRRTPRTTLCRCPCAFSDAWVSLSVPASL
jgi:hypothetical protein